MGKFNNNYFLQLKLIIMQYLENNRKNEVIDLMELIYTYEGRCASDVKDDFSKKSIMLFEDTEYEVEGYEEVVEDYYVIQHQAVY